jgi:hypothetical protein
MADLVRIQEVVFRPAKFFTAGAGLQPEVASQVRASLAAPTLLSAVESIVQEPGMERILDATTRLEPRFVVDIFDRVRNIPDQTERQLKGRGVTFLFEQRLERRKISQQKIHDVLFKLSSSNKKVHVPADGMTADVAAIIPETASAADPPLLTMEGEQAVFDAPQFQRLRSMAAAV